MTKTLSYVLMDPTKNQTILVETPVPVPEQPAVAARLMQEEPSAEQAGFLSVPADVSSSSPAISLRMAGGEFCGNAAMSAAVYYAMHAEMTKGRVAVQVSGTPDPVTVTVSARPEDGLWEGIVDMPRPLSMERKTLSLKQTAFPEDQGLFQETCAFPVVTFRGITHILLDRDPPLESERETAEILAKTWCTDLQADALGLLFLNEKKSSLTPLVYVKTADTLFWENSCASGTTAAGAWLAKETRQPVNRIFRQPGGTLEISAEPDGPLLLKGTVRCQYRKTVVL